MEGLINISVEKYVARNKKQRKTLLVLDHSSQGAVTCNQKGCTTTLDGSQ